MNNPSTSRKKTYHYHSEWEEDYFFTMMKDKCICFICNATVALSKKENVKRHYLTNHKNYEEDYPRGTALRKTKVQQLKAQITAQQNSFLKYNTNSKTATIASFKVAETLIKHNKPFQDGEIWKEAFIKAGEELFQNFKNKSEIMTLIKNMSLSRNTVMRRTEGMSRNLEDILHENINKCVVLSLQFDESTDYIGTAQLCVFIRMVFDDMLVTEELLTIIPMHDRTRGQDIFDLFKNYIARTNFPICKLVSITTDGAPAMIGNKSGFVALCKGDDDIPNFIDYHCIIHTQILCSKVLKFNHVMDVAFKIVNSIRSKSLSRRQFRALLNECGEEHNELLLHTDVRWLSHATFLARFRELLPQITSYLQSKGDSYPQLNDQEWLLDLAFFCDVTEKLNQLNQQLQGKGKTIIHMISILKSFKEKLNMLAMQLKRRDLKHYQNLADESKNNKTVAYDKYADVIGMLLNEFDRRFLKLSELEDIACFLSYPFNDIDVESLAQKLHNFLNTTNIAELEEEILNIKCDINLKSMVSDSNFWKLISKDKYPNIWTIVARFNAFFGSTYLCESAFSYMNAIKTKQRSQITDLHLESCLRIALSSYEPNFEKLAALMQCQVSSK